MSMTAPLYTLIIVTYGAFALAAHADEFKAIPFVPLDIAQEWKCLPFDPNRSFGGGSTAGPGEQCGWVQPIKTDLDKAAEICKKHTEWTSPDLGDPAVTHPYFYDDFRFESVCAKVRARFEKHKDDDEAHRKINADLDFINKALKDNGQ